MDKLLILTHTIPIKLFAKEILNRFNIVVGFPFNLLNPKGINFTKVLVKAAKYIELLFVKFIQLR